MRNGEIVTEDERRVLWNSLLLENKQHDVIRTAELSLAFTAEINLGADMIKSLEDELEMAQRFLGLLGCVNGLCDIRDKNPFLPEPSAD